MLERSEPWHDPLLFVPPSGTPNDVRHSKGPPAQHTPEMLRILRNRRCSQRPSAVAVIVGGGCGLYSASCRFFTAIGCCVSKEHSLVL